MTSAVTGSTVHGPHAFDYEMDNPPPRSVVGGPVDPALTVREVMTPAPHTIDIGQPLTHAYDMIRELGLQHLPVLESGVLVGILSQRDLYFHAAVSGPVTGIPTVETVMVRQVYTAEPGDRVCDVARMMGEHHYGCTVIVDGRRVVGIFTATDALRLLTRLTSTDPPSDDGLRADHERIESVYADLARAYRRGDWREVQVAWTTFDLSLRTHMDFEERHLQQAFERANPAATKAILDQHAELRGLLSTLGVAVDLHAVREPQIDELLARLRAHSAHVEQVFSSWLGK